NIKEGSDYTIVDVDNTIILPNANLNGQISVTVTVSDINDGESNEFSYLVDINPVNDLPVITDQVNPRDHMTVVKGMTIDAIELDDLRIDDSDSDEILTVVIDYTNNDTDTDIHLPPNNNYTGSLTINLHINDGTDDSEQFGYQLTVVSANNIPVITDQVNP